MVVRVDFSSLPGHLRNTIMNEIGFKNRSEKMPSSHFNELSDVDKDKSKGGDVVDEVSLVEENNTHR
jgi:hypothetical protein